MCDKKAYRYMTRQLTGPGKDNFQFDEKTAYRSMKKKLTGLGHFKSMIRQLTGYAGFQIPLDPVFFDLKDPDPDPKLLILDPNPAPDPPLFHPKLKNIFNNALKSESIFIINTHTIIENPKKIRFQPFCVFA